MIVGGDFNSTCHQLEEAGWLDLLNVQPILPNVDTTLKNAKDRVIYFILVSKDIQHIVVDVQPDLTTPWAHVGSSFAILARPREYHVMRVRQPAQIPVDGVRKLTPVEGQDPPVYEDSSTKSLKEIWEGLSEEDKHKLALDAKDKARGLLNKQKIKQEWPFSVEPIKH